jgi:hypothetical protein
MTEKINKGLKVEGKSGKKYSFKIYEIEEKLESLDGLCSEFKKVGGLYIFTKRHETDTNQYSHTRIYCGKTKDLSERFDDHHKEECIMENNPNCICIMQENDEKEREAIETYILENKNFLCNEMLN